LGVIDVFGVVKGGDDDEHFTLAFFGEGARPEAPLLELLSGSGKVGPYDDGGEEQDEQNGEDEGGVEAPGVLFAPVVQQGGQGVEVDAAFDVGVVADDADLTAGDGDGGEDAVEFVVGEGEVEFTDLDGIVAGGLSDDGDGVVVADASPVRVRCWRSKVSRLGWGTGWLLEHGWAECTDFVAGGLKVPDHIALATASGSVKTARLLCW
jgi:hypothetical protein